MRAIALLFSSLALTACGKTETIDLTAKLNMSGVQADWCGSLNKDTIRMDCPFEIGFYVTQVLSVDAGFENTKLLSTTCVKLNGQADRTWADLPMALNDNKATIGGMPGGSTIRLSMAVIQPPTIADCDHDLSTAKGTPAFTGESDPVDLDANPDPDAPSIKRIDVQSKCVKPFEDAGTCLATP